MKAYPIPQDRHELLAFARQHYNPDLVAIDKAAFESCGFPRGALQLMKSDLVGKPQYDDAKNAVAFLLGLNAVNHRFWTPPVDGVIGRYAYEGKKGAMGWRRAYDKAWGPEGSLENLREATASVETMRAHFGDLPDMEGRHRIFQEMLAGNLLRQEASHIVSELRTGRPVGVSMAARLAAKFPAAYGDPFLKKAQLALAEIAGHFAETWGIDPKIDLTAFADYQVPRVLRFKGILVYSKHVANLVDSMALIPEGSLEELAVCAAVILGCAMLADYFGTSDAAVDNFVWLLRNAVPESMPFHLVMTNRY